MFNAMAKRSKFYAVKRGLKTGIFTSWDETKPLVHNFKGPQFKSFNTKEEALEYMNSSNQVIKKESISKVNEKEFQKAHQSKYGSLQTPLIKTNDVVEDNLGETHTVYRCPISKLKFASLGSLIYLNISGNAFSWKHKDAFVFVDVSDNSSFIFDTYKLLQNHMEYRKKCTRTELKSAFFHRKVPSVEYAYKYLTNRFHDFEDKYMKKKNIPKLRYKNFEKAEKSPIHAYCDGSSDLKAMGKGIYYDLKYLPPKEIHYIEELLKEHGGVPDQIDTENKQTNNIAELAACRHVFEDLLKMYRILNRRSYKKIFRVIIHTDSAYSLFAIEKHVVNIDLKKGNIANKQHIEACMEPYLKLKKFYRDNKAEHMFIMKWVPGHLDVVGNQKADALAYNALKGTYVHNHVSDVSSDEHNKTKSNDDVSYIDELSTDSDLDEEVFKKKPLEEDETFEYEMCQLLKTSFELDNKKMSENKDNSDPLLDTFKNNLRKFKKNYSLDPTSQSTENRFPWIVLKAKLENKIDKFNDLRSPTQLNNMKQKYQEQIITLENKLSKCQETIEFTTAEANNRDVSKDYAKIRKFKASLCNTRKILKIVEEYYKKHYQSKISSKGNKRSTNLSDETDALPLLKKQKLKEATAIDDKFKHYDIIEISSSSE